MTPLPQYQSMVSVVKTTISDADRHELNARMARVNVLFILAIIAALVGVALLLASVPVGAAACFVCAVALVAFALYQRKSIPNHYISLIVDKCDPQGAVDGLVALAEHVSAKSWAEDYFRVADALYYAGRFSEARAVARILAKYAEEPLEEFLSEALYCRVCAQEGDIDGLERHVAQMRSAGRSIRLTSEQRRLFEEMARLPKLMNLEMEGAVVEAYDVAKASFEAQHMPIEKVKGAYSCARLARKIGERNEAARYRQFVLERGGTTYFKHELLGEQEDQIRSAAQASFNPTVSDRPVAQAV